MLKTIIRAMYSAFISIVLISIILAIWACFAFISQPKKSGEIINVIHDMYENQKSVILDVADLSKLLLRDTSEKIASENNNLLAESEFNLDQKGKSLFEEPSVNEDNGNNPLGIVIESSIPELSEENISEISKAPLDSDQSEVSINDMEIEMDMN